MLVCDWCVYIWQILITKRNFELPESLSLSSVANQHTPTHTHTHTNTHTHSHTHTLMQGEHALDGETLPIKAITARERERWRETERGKDIERSRNGFCT